MVDKLRWDWLPPEAMKEVVKVLTEGSKTKGDKNPLFRSIKVYEEWTAAQRHLWKWRAGKEYDEDSKKHHLAHAIARLLLALQEDLN